MDREEPRVQRADARLYVDFQLHVVQGSAVVATPNSTGGAI